MLDVRNLARLTDEGTASLGRDVLLRLPRRARGLTRVVRLDRLLAGLARLIPPFFPLPFALAVVRHPPLVRGRGRRAARAARRRRRLIGAPMAAGAKTEPRRRPVEHRSRRPWARKAGPRRTPGPSPAARHAVVLRQVVRLLACVEPQVSLGTFVFCLLHAGKARTVRRRELGHSTVELLVLL